MTLRRSICAALIGASALALPSLSSARTPAAAGLPSTDQVLAKYENFLGGASALSKVGSRTVTQRRMEVGGTPQDNIVVRRSKMPGLSLLHFRTIDDQFLQYMNGCDQAGPWTNKLGATGAPQSGIATNDAHCAQDLYFFGYLPLSLAALKANDRLEVKAKLQILPADPGSAGAMAGGRGKDLIPAGPRDVYLVLVTPVHSTDQYEWLYFDVQTGALLRQALAGKGPVPIAAGLSTSYHDHIQYRDVGDGTRSSFQFVSVGPHVLNRTITIRVDDTPLPDSLFPRPKDVSREDKGF
jgi:hypothetical protein